MHEAAITRSVVEQADAEAERANADRVTAIRLLIGESAGVVPESVSFYFDEMSKGSRAEGAKLEFRRIPLVLRCPKCGAEFGSIEDICGCNAGADVVSGQEMVIESIEIEND